jgi:hypothetical protein
LQYCCETVTSIICFLWQLNDAIKKSNFLKIQKLTFLSILSWARYVFLKFGWAVPWLRSLVAGLSPRRPGFAPGSIHVGLVVEKVSLGQAFLRVLRFSPVNISFHRLSSNSYHLGNALYADVSRNPRLGTRPTPSSGEKSSDRTRYNTPKKVSLYTGLFPS